jgi:hypothetical protein
VTLAGITPRILAARCGDLVAMRAGWFGGVCEPGVPLCPAMVGRAHAILLMVWAKGFPLPFVYPTPEGYLLAEWGRSPTGWSASVTFGEPTGDWLFWCDLDGDGCEERAVALTDEGPIVEMLAASGWQGWAG